MVRQQRQPALAEGAGIGSLHEGRIPTISARPAGMDVKRGLFTDPALSARADYPPSNANSTPGGS